LDITRLREDKSGRIQPKKKKFISVAEFDDVGYQGQDPAIMDPALITWHKLVLLLKKEFNFDERLQSVRYVAPDSVQETARTEDEREIDSDASLRGAIKVLQNGGRFQLPLFIRGPEIESEEEV